MDSSYLAVNEVLKVGCPPFLHPPALAIALQSAHSRALLAAPKGATFCLRHLMLHNIDYAAVHAALTCYAARELRTLCVEAPPGAAGEEREDARDTVSKVCAEGAVDFHVVRLPTPDPSSMDLMMH